MFVEIDNERFDALPQLSREMINETSNGSVLADWYDTLIEKAAAARRAPLGAPL